MSTAVHRLLTLALVGLAVTALGGCAGELADDDDDGLEIAETGSATAALTSPEPAESATEDGDARGERGGCDEHDRDGHKHHRRHKMRVLDRLDGTKDHQITIASLPAGLPERLLARLHAIDADGDGVVTRAEAKAARHGRHRRR